MTSALSSDGGRGGIGRQVSMSFGVSRLLQMLTLLVLARSHAAADADEDEASCPAEGGCSSAPAAGCAASGDAAWQPRTLSVVLPCAGEGDFVVKTAESVSKSVPGGG